MVGSDVPAVLEHSHGFVHLEDGDIATVAANNVEIYHRRELVHRRVHHVNWGPEDVDKGGYEHFLLKEIHEQPRVLRDTLAGRITADGHVDLDLKLGRRTLPEELFFLGCGSASHAAMVGAHFVSALTDTRVEALEASEVVRPKRRGPEAWSVLVSQSGETADTVDAAKDARRAGHFTLALTNVPESSITRVAHATHNLRAGQEISVASSKTYLAQLMGLYMLGLALYPPADRRRRLALVSALRRLPEAVQQALAMAPQLERLGAGMASAEHAFIIGKGTNYPTALEGALKFKEVAYLHAEGYASGELKHGPFALLGPETPVIAIMPRDDTYDRMLVAVEEIHSRRAPIIALTDCDNAELQSIAQSVVCLPPTDAMFTPVVGTVALQLMAYYCALAKGCPIDRPRNLAKSVHYGALTNRPSRPPAPTSRSPYPPGAQAGTSPSAASIQQELRTGASRARPARAGPHPVTQGRSRTPPSFPRTREPRAGAIVSVIPAVVPAAGRGVGNLARRRAGAAGAAVSRPYRRAGIQRSKRWP